MAIFLDDVEIDGEGGVTIAAALDGAQAALEGTGRVVIDVRLDGELLQAEAIEHRREEPVGRESELRLYSADPRELAAGTLEQVRVSLEESRKSLGKASEMFQEDRSGEAMEAVGALVRTWLQSQQAVLDSTRIVNVDLDAIEFEGEPLITLFNDLADRLRSLKEQLDHADALGLADTLGYEWPEVTDRWQKMLGELILVVSPGDAK